MIAMPVPMIVIVWSGGVGAAGICNSHGVSDVGFLRVIINPVAKKKVHMTCRHVYCRKLVLVDTSRVCYSERANDCRMLINIVKAKMFGNG